MIFLGGIASILGIVTGLLSLTVIETTPEYYFLPSASLFIESAPLTLLFSIIGLVATILVKVDIRKYIRISAILMFVAGIGGFIFMSYSYIPSTILFFIAGLIGLFKKLPPKVEKDPWI